MLAAAVLWLWAVPASYATFPGTNGRIAFESTRDGGDFEIVTTNPDGTGVTQLTANSADDRTPKWSATGTKIAFFSTRDGDPEIFTMYADGTGQTQLTFNSWADQSPHWSPDGTKLAFNSNQDGDVEIYTMNADGSGTPTQLTFNAAEDAAPAWSPDGTKIAFQSSRDGGAQQIYVMNADGTGQTRLTNNSFQDVEPDWSPDGTKITFRRDGAGNGAEAYVMNADGSGQTALTSNPNYDSDPDWSPDGTMLTFISNRDDASFEVYTMNADGSAQTRITTRAGPDFSPDWGRAREGASVLASGFNCACGVALAAGGSIYVADSNNGRIVKLSSGGALLGQASGGNPTDVAVDGSGNVYASYHADRVEKFDANLNHLTGWGASGSGDGQFNFTPYSGVSADVSGNVYVLDGGNSRVQKFDSSGNFLDKWGSAGSGDGQFKTPTSVSADGSGNVYVLDGGNNRVQKFNSNGDFVTTWGTTPGGPSGGLLGIANDASGHVYVGDTTSPGGPIQKFNAQGALVTGWVAGSFGLADLQPDDIAIDSGGRAYVANYWNLLRFDTADTYASLEASRELVLTGQPVTFDACQSAAPVAAAIRYSWDFDGNGSFETNTPSQCRVTRSFSQAGVLKVRLLVSGGGVSDTAPVTLDVRLAPPPGPLGVTINGAATYTSDPNVTVSPVWPAFTRTVSLSNDGGFGAARTVPLAFSVPWTLDSSGPERLPKTVYVRFDGSSQTFTDDIILDETAPKVEEATLAGGAGASVTAARQRRHRIHLRAKDNASGVRGYQVTTNKRKPGKLQRFKKRRLEVEVFLQLRSQLVQAVLQHRELHVRVRDAAGNNSKWRQVKRKRRPR